MTTTTRHRASLVAAASLSIGGLLVAAGCNDFATTTPASLAPPPPGPGNFTGTTQPIRNWGPSVAYYQNGDTPSGSTGVRYVNGIGYNGATQGGQTGPAGGYGYVGANNAAGGAGGASGETGVALAGSSDTGFTAGAAGVNPGGTGLAGTNAAPSGGVAVAGANGSGSVSGTGSTINPQTGTITGPVTGTTATPGSSAADANQTAANNNAGVVSNVGQASGTTPGINDAGTVSPGRQTLNTNNDAAAISGSNTVSAPGSAAGSPAGTGTIGGTDVTGRTGVDANGIGFSTASNTAGNTAVAGNINGTGTSIGASGTAGGQPSAGDQARAATLSAAAPIYGTGVFFANVVTSPVTLIQERNGIVSTGVQFPRTYTAMPALPPSPSDSPVYPQDRPVTIKGQKPGVPPTTAPIGANLAGSMATTSPVKPAILTPVENDSSKTAFTIAGDVQFPGRYKTGTNVTISQAIIGAGVNSAVDPTAIHFHLARDGQQPADATLAALNGKQVQDIVLKPGDVLTVSIPHQPLERVGPSSRPATTRPARAIR